MSHESSDDRKVTDKKVEAGLKNAAPRPADELVAAALLWCGPDGVAYAPRANGAHPDDARANEEGGLGDLDFGALAAGDEGRVLKAASLKRKLGVRDGVVSAPVAIRHAVIEVEDGGTLDLSRLTFKRGLSVTDSVFKGNVDFSFCAFERGVDLTGTAFEGRAEFRGARVEGDFRIPLAAFGAHACFDDLCVHELLNAEGADFKTASFDRAEARKSVRFCCALLTDGRAVRTRFRGEVTFNDARLSGPAYFAGAHFLDKVYFDRARIDSSVFFNCDLLSTKADPSQPRHDAHPPPRRMVEAESVKFFPTEFEDTASFIGARVNGSASFSGARFGSEAASAPAPGGGESAPRADFRRVQIEGTALFDPFVYKDKDSDTFRRVRFNYDANFWNAGIKGAAQFEAAYFGGAANFEHVQIGRRAYFDAAGPDHAPTHAHFRGEANFADAHIGGTASFEGAQFDADADFERLTTGGSLYFRAYVADTDPPAAGAAGGKVVIPVRFARSVRFHGCQTRSNVEFGGAKFLAAPPAKDGEDNDEEANFSRMVVGGSLSLRRRRGTVEDVRFGERAVFTGADIKGRAEFSGTFFGADADFTGMHVGGNAYFGYRFRQKEKEEDARRDGGAPKREQLPDSNKEQPADAKGDGRRKQIDPATFHGPAGFNGANFDNQVSFEGVVFEREADFTGVSSVGSVTFREAKFRSDAVFRDARFSSLRFDRKGPPRRGWLISVPTRLWALRSRESNGKYKRERDKEKIEARQFRRTVDLRGCVYDRMEVKLRSLLKSVKGSAADDSQRYDRQPYTQMSRTLRAVGDDRRAEFVYVKQRIREVVVTWNRLLRDLKSLLLWRAFRDAANLLLDLFLWAVAQFGVQPERLLVISIVVLAAGARVFSFDGAVQYKEPDPEAPPTATIQTTPKGEPWKFALDKDKRETPNLVWQESVRFSVSQFLPVVDIPSGSKWKPAQKGSFWFVSRDLLIPYDVYGSAHRVLGAVLVPLLLAAVAASLYRRFKTEM